MFYLFVHRSLIAWVYSIYTEWFIAALILYSYSIIVRLWPMHVSLLLLMCGSEPLGVCRYTNTVKERWGK